MTWVVIKFVSSDEVEAVPSCWYNETTNVCYYPPYQRSALERAIRLRSPPDTNWNAYEAQLMSKSKYTTFQQATAKACLTSDLSDTEVGLPEKRIRKPKILSDSDDNTSEESLNFPKTPMAITKKVEYTRKTLEKPRAETTGLSCADSETFGSTSQIFASTSIEDKVLDYPHFKKQVVEYMVKHKNNLKILEKRTGDLQKTADDTKVMVQRISEILITQNNQTEENLIRPCKTVFQTLPIKTIQELENLDEELNRENNYNELFTDLTRFGGSTYKDCVKRFMKRTLSDDIARLYSMVGHKGKKAFSKTRLCSLIIEAVKHLEKTVTNKEVELFMAVWLSKAKERLGRDKKDNNLEDESGNEVEYTEQ